MLGADSAACGKLSGAATECEVGDNSGRVRCDFFIILNLMWRKNFTPRRVDCIEWKCLDSSFASLMAGANFRLKR
jgi:hypothetical protein